ncbi:MAG TPA: hypothetical protein G4N96_13685 [Chloroflexi bacterium]|nr:hypothetical protein [Chloroflexota bacterium]
MENKQDDIDSDPDSDSAPPVQANKKAERLVILLIGLTFFACFSLMCLSGVVYLVVPNLIDDLPLSHPLTNPPIKNQIAFVGNDRNVWLVSPDGSDLRVVSDSEREHRGYASPVWSPDGRYLAFLGQDANRHNALYIASDNFAAPHRYYNVEESSPFYLYWSPDSQALSFLTQETDAIALWRLDMASPKAPRVLDWGNPFYWDWSPASDEMLAHVGGSWADSEQAQLSFVRTQEKAARIELQITPGHFQAPLWSADGQFIYYVVADETGQEAIYRMSYAALEQRKLQNLPAKGATWLTLSPDGRRIAYLKTDNKHPIPFGSVFVMDADGQNHRLLTQRSVSSVYWSPDSSKVALLIASFDDTTPTVKGGGLASPAEQQMQFQWWIYHLHANQFELLSDIDPSPEFFKIVPYFDQYHHSLTFWSPDSRYFVITTEVADNDAPLVVVLDSAGQESPRVVGEGVMAVWSWQ